MTYTNTFRDRSFLAVADTGMYLWTGDDRLEVGVAPRPADALFTLVKDTLGPFDDGAVWDGDPATWPMLALWLLLRCPACEARDEARRILAAGAGPWWITAWRGAPPDGEALPDFANFATEREARTAFAAGKDRDVFRHVRNDLTHLELLGPGVREVVVAV